MHEVTYLIAPAAFLMVCVALCFLIVAIMRGRQIPQCFRCGALKVRPSRPSGLLELAGVIFRIQSYRCLGCRERFHALRLSNRSSF
jgi:hypothetical protein